MSGAPAIGELRHRVALEAFTRSADGGGGATGSWTLVAEVWAAVLPLSGDESFMHDRLAGRQQHSVWVRYRDGVTPDLRLRFGNRVFDIRAVVNVEERGRWLKLEVEERDL